jgi:hypothetical protein
MYKHTIKHHLCSKQEGRPIFPQRMIYPLFDCRRLFIANNPNSNQAWKALINHMAKHRYDGRTFGLGDMLGTTVNAPGNIRINSQLLDVSTDFQLPPAILMITPGKF